MVRTVLSPRCCATSKTRRTSKFGTSKAFMIGGRAPSNCTSTTAPMTCDTLPMLLLVSSAKHRRCLPRRAGAARKEDADARCTWVDSIVYSTHLQKATKKLCYETEPKCL